MCNCREREQRGVDVRRLNVDAETKARLERYGTVDIVRDAHGVRVSAGGFTVYEKDGISAVKALADLTAQLVEG